MHKFVAEDKSTELGESFSGKNLLEFGVQTECQRWARALICRSSLHARDKRVQTDLQMLISRPAQTQLSSTFQKKCLTGTDNQLFPAGSEEGNIAALEAVAHGKSSPFSNVQKELIELKKNFRFDDEVKCRNTLE